MEMAWSISNSLWDDFGVTLGWISGSVGVALGSYWGHFVVSWGRFGHSRVTLEHLGANSGAHWRHFGHLSPTLDHHEVTLSHFRGLFGGTFDI